MSRPIILGVVGDSGTGKSTLTRGLVDILGSQNVTHIRMADYHRYDRVERAELGLTALHPDANHLDILAQHLRLVRNGEPILKPVYRHEDGTFVRAEYVVPKPFVVVEGLLGYHTSELSSLYDVRVYVEPPEELRHMWKMKRDVAKRGYSNEQVQRELENAELDSEAFIRPQEHRADLVVSFRPGELTGADHMDAFLTLREGLAHPDMSVVVGDGRADGLTLIERGRERILYVPGDIAGGAEIAEKIWGRMQFASHLRADRLGAFSIGSEEFRSESLAIVQLVILYHAVTAKAIVALGGDHASARSTPNAKAPAPSAPAAPVPT